MGPRDREHLHVATVGGALARGEVPPGDQRPRRLRSEFEAIAGSQRAALEAPALDQEVRRGRPEPAVGGDAPGDRLRFRQSTPAAALAAWRSLNEALESID